MANLGAPGKTAGDITDELLTFNVENMQNNAKIIYYRFVLYCTWMSFCFYEIPVLLNKFCAVI